MSTEDPKPEQAAGPLPEAASSGEAPQQPRSTPANLPATGPSPDFMLAEEAVPVQPMPPVLPSPAEAALQAARIVSQIVDIDSESGAVIAAAAAAGAAIEAAVAAQKAIGEADANRGDLPTADSGSDPISTVKLSRDRILRALEHEDANREAAARPGRARTDPGAVRARTDPGAPRARADSGGAAIVGDASTDEGAAGDDVAFGEIDPVAIAAAAIARLRARARTDLAELRVHYRRHDIVVLLAAFVIIIAAGRLHARMVTPPNTTFSEHGLTFAHSQAWLTPEPIPPPSPRLVRDLPSLATTKDDAYYHVALTSSVAGTARIEVQVDKKPGWSNIVTGLELDRRTRWGELYAQDDSSVTAIAGHDWLRTTFHYAHEPEKGDVPRIDRAIEYATIDRDQIYVISLFGTPLELDRMDEVIEPSLRVQTQTGLPLVPETSRVTQHTYPPAVARAFESTVMVVVADVIDGRLKARGGGSGVIVAGDGSILTNYHVVHDKDGRLHDVFVIGKLISPDKPPMLWCAGRPNRSKLQRDVDLALIKCDTDLDGRAWNPASTGVWATLKDARARDVKMGQRLWVLGYPDVGGGGLTLSEGEVEGWTGVDGAAGDDFIKTDASITHGNSGGPVVSDAGELVGVASAFRTRVTASGSVIETAQVGLVRPLGKASDLLAIAEAGWTPREGHTDVELAPTAVEAAAEGVRISTTVVDNANEAPVRDALVMVLRPGVNASTIDMNRLDDQTIAWGKTNGQGEVRLKQPVPVPGTYTVMVVAPGYEPLIGESELHLDAATPASFDPWGKIWLRAR
jgi:S1-C subfamily serine protease